MNDFSERWQLYPPSAKPSASILIVKGEAHGAAPNVPFNFLAMIPIWTLAPAIAVGNAFILKPPERTPSAAVRLAELARALDLFRTGPRHNANTLTDRPMNQYAAWLMIRRRAAAAGIAAPIGCHTFRATGITAYLANGGALEHAQEMAAHESPRTMKL